MFETGPDSFYTALDQLAPMRTRYRSGGFRVAPPPVAPPPIAAARVPLRRRLHRPSRRRPTVDAMLALPAWHVVTTADDPTFPDLAVHDTELVAQVYSSVQALARRGKPGAPPPPTAVMTPAEALTLLSDIELVGIVRFDGELDVPFVDLKLRAHRME